jgi:hypothetical protein
VNNPTSTGVKLDAVRELPEPSRSGRLLQAVTGPGMFVWMVWALLLVTGLVFVRKYGSNVPWWDDWELVKVVTGHERASASLLWASHNEHRIPVPILIQLGTGRLTGIDYRGGMVLNIVLLGGAAAALMLAAARQRGEIVYTDAFLPLVLLNLGHWNNLLWSFQIQFVLSAVIACLVLAAIVRDRLVNSSLDAGLMVIALLVLPFTGANGVALVPAFALWTGMAAAKEWRQPTISIRWRARMLALVAVVAIALSGLYLFSFDRLHRASPTIAALVRTACQFLIMGWGQCVVRFWSLGGWVTLALLMLCGLILVSSGRYPEEKPMRRLGLALFLSAIICLALGIGWGRAALKCQDPGLAPRYVTLAAPMLCAVYMISQTLGPRVLRPALGLWLLVLACLVSVPNVQEGLACGAAQRAILHRFERDLRSGMPCEELAARYENLIYPNRTRLARLMPMLHSARAGVFRYLRENDDRQASMRLSP